MDFYNYQMMHNSIFNIILRSKDLFHQYIVNIYAKNMKSSIILKWIRGHFEKYEHLKDAINNDGNVADIGQLIILPSSFIGSQNEIENERIQDAMTYVKNYDRPDLFITFACNPKWSEIQQELIDGQSTR